MKHGLKPTRCNFSSAQTFSPSLWDDNGDDEPWRPVIDEIKSDKRKGIRVLKIIHGYGSSGKGGALCTGLRKSFGLRKKEGVIKDFLAGEDFSIFNNTTLSLLEAVPELRGDSDFNATNEGVTVLWLK
jgi:hypothetical protein